MVRLWMVLGSSLALFGTNACGFYTAVPEDTVFGCAEDDDCAFPEAPVCDSVRKRCVPVDQLDIVGPRTSSSVIEPLRGRADTVFRLTLAFDEPVTAVQVALDVGTVQHAFRRESAENGTFVFAFAADNVTLPSGVYPVVVTATDVQGNEARRDVGDIQLDVDAPSLISPQASTPTISPHVPLTLRFSLDETLAGLPLVEAAMGEERVVLDVSENADSSYSATWTIGEGEAEGVYDVSVEATDEVGNAARSETVTSVRLDRTAPVVTQVVVPDDQVRAAEPFTLSVIADEPIASAGALTLTHVVTGEAFVIEGNVSALGSSVVYTAVFDEGDDGTYTLELGALGDTWLNTSLPAPLEETVSVDATTPGVTDFSQSHIAAQGSDTISITFTPSEPLAALPEVTLSGGALGVNLPLTLSGGAVDPLGPLTYTLDLSTVQTTGVHEFRVTLQDLAGLVGFSIPGTLTVDALAPALQTAGFAPQSAGLGQLVTLLVVPSETLSGPPTLIFDGPDPGFVPGPETGGGFTFQRVVDGTLTEGGYHLIGLGGSDLAGNAGVVDVDFTLNVDNVAPSITALSTDRPRYSAIAPYDSALVRFNLSESVDNGGTLGATIGGTSLNCESYSADTPNYTCSGTLPFAGITEDTLVIVQVAARDAAGNLAPEGLTAALLDVTPPAVVNPTVAVSIADLPGIDDIRDDRLHIDSRAVLYFEASEPLASTPVVTLQPSGASFTLDQASNNQQFQYVFHRNDASLSAGEYSIQVAMTDTVGHAQTVTLLKTVTVPRLVPSPCVATDATGQAEPTDYDGDGYFGWSDACPNGAVCDDCDDDDAVTHPGAQEIPGDGRDNRCTGGADGVVDESVGVFVVPGAPSGGTGTRALPFNSYVDGLNAAKATNRELFLASGTLIVDDTPQLTGTSLFGGFDAASWTITNESARTTLRSPTSNVFLSVILLGRGAVLSRLVLDGVLMQKGGSGPIVIADSTLGVPHTPSAHYVEASVTMTRSVTLETVVWAMIGETARLVENETAINQHQGSGRYISIRNIVHGTYAAEQVRNGTDAIYISNWFDVPRRVFELQGMNGSLVAIGNSHHANADFSDSDFVSYDEGATPSSGPFHLRLINNAAIPSGQTNTYAFVKESQYMPLGVTFEAYGNALGIAASHWFDPQNGQPHAGFQALAGDGLGGCPRGAGDPCIGAADNQVSTEPFIGATPGLGTNSDLVGAGVDVADVFGGAHTARAADLFGQCRPSQPTIGAIEP